MGSQRIVVESNGVVVAASDHEITLGARTGADVVIDDPVIADRHCRITFEGTFQLRDLGSVTGTWLDGKRAAAFSELQEGSEIVIGTARLIARITKDGGASTLTLDLQRGAFWWKKPGKGVFDNDPDALVRAEVGFGRFPLLHVSTRVAAIAAAVLLIAALLFASVFEPLVDAGPLVPAHAAVRDLDANAVGVHAALAKCAQIADEQGCAACHDRGNGTPQSKCMQCHDDLRQRATWRHPFLGDGQIGAVPGIDTGEGFCGVCHRDHQGADFLKARSRELVGKCEACHRTGDAPFDVAALRSRAPEIRIETRDRAYSTIRFPHDRHRDPAMRCDLCHRPDAGAVAASAKGLDDPDAHDFGEVPFETCAACHVPGRPAVAGMTDSEQATWRDKAKTHQWDVTWHGTGDGGKCAQCHVSSQRDGVAVHGPELKTVERGKDTVESYANDRATFVAGRRMHDDEFRAHAGGKQCVECHVRGSLVGAAAPRAAVFWHALHLTASGLAPLPGNAGAVSRDETVGCLSCHGDRRNAASLRPAADGAFAWPSDAEAQKVCSGCHADGGKATELRATEQAIAADQRRTAIAFPHDAHVGAGSFGKPGSSLADGCFSCHEFAVPNGGSPLHAVPRTKPKAADCTQCHQQHAEVGGGSCAQCHPAAANAGATSFSLAARVADRRAPSRPWPGANGFSHSSPGHSGLDLDGKPIACSLCHDDQATRDSKTLDAVPIPNESHPACRQCHLQQQFHWR